MRFTLKTLPLLLLPLASIGFAQTASQPPAPRVITPAIAAHLPAPVGCNANKGSCWKPTIGMEWNWQLSCDTAKTCTNLKVHVPFYVIDAIENPTSTVAAIHRRGGHVYCYVDIGSWEDTRADASKFPASVLGKRYIGWPHERWLDIRQMGVLAPIMIARMQVCVQKHFDGVEFDNVGDWDNPTGFPITQQESAYYTAWMANQAHEMGLSASWENARANVPVLEPYMQALIFEQCFQYHTCSDATPMIRAGKWVGGVEYVPSYKDLRFCPTYAKYRIVGAFKKLALKSWRLPCAPLK